MLNISRGDFPYGCVVALFDMAYLCMYCVCVYLGGVFRWYTCAEVDEILRVHTSIVSKESDDLIASNDKVVMPCQQITHWR